MEKFTIQEIQILISALDNTLDTLERNRRILTDREEIELSINQFTELRDKIRNTLKNVESKSES